MWIYFLGIMISYAAEVPVFNHSNKKGQTGHATCADSLAVGHELWERAAW